MEFQDDHFSFQSVMFSNFLLIHTVHEKTQFYLCSFSGCVKALVLSNDRLPLHAALCFIYFPVFLAFVEIHACLSAAEDFVFHRMAIHHRQ